jgi:hypothetical protein
LIIGTKNRTIPSFKAIRRFGGAVALCVSRGMSLILLFLITSCSTPDHLSQKDLQSYIQDESNGLSKSVEAGAVTMKVNYRPNDFLIWQEMEDEEDLSKITEVQNRYKNYIYFIMQLSAGEKDALYGITTNQMDFNDRLQTLSFRMNQFVNLTTSEQDTIPVADAYYTRMFGLSKSNDILFVFNREKIDTDQWISFNTKDFGFRTGRKSFRFDLESINNAPRLLELKPFYENK